MTSGKDINAFTKIKRIELTDSYKTLGVHISPSGSNTGAMEILTNIKTAYNLHITASFLSRQKQ
jgi:hypothetical protein